MEEILHMSQLRIRCGQTPEYKLYITMEELKDDRYSDHIFVTGAVCHFWDIHKIISLTENKTGGVKYCSLKNSRENYVHESG